MGAGVNKDENTQLQGSVGQKVGNWKRRQTWNGGICRRSLISLSQSQPQSLLTRYLTNPSRSLRQITTLTTTLTFPTIKSPPPSLFTPPPPSLLHDSNICHQCNCDDCKVETRGFLWNTSPTSNSMAEPDDWLATWIFQCMIFVKCGGDNVVWHKIIGA